MSEYIPGPPMNYQELAKEIHDLADRLDTNKTCLTDVVGAILQNVRLVTGQPHHTTNREVQEALDHFAAVFVRVFERDGIAMMNALLFSLGYNVGRGKLGSNFFANIGSR